MGMVMKMVHEVGGFWFEFRWKENGEKKRRKGNFEVKSEKVRVVGVTYYINLSQC